MEAQTEQTELFIALVAAVGTDIGLVGDLLQTHLSEYGFTSQLLRLSHYLAEQAENDFREKPFDEMLWDAMTAGDELRRRWDRSDALSLHAVTDIVATREQVAEEGGWTPHDDDEPPPSLSRHAFILRSLKTPDELETLRAIYGPRLIVIAAYSPEEMRERHLAELIEDSRQSSDRATWKHQPRELIARDEKEEARRGQDVSGTFHRADFFIRGWNREVIKADVARTLEILFGSPFRSPTRDEYGQFLAAGAALRSTEFGRQVGAAIATPAGSVIALGTNEVPAVGGGSHWEEDGLGNRDFEVGDQDSNRQHFDDLATRLASQIDARLDDLADELGTSDETHSALTSLREEMHKCMPEDLREAGLKDLTEFGRAVHAEMNALLDAARRGAPVADATLYTTTFPCHNCARHIIGAGIMRIVFVEPYEKSRAMDLHADALATGSPVGTKGKIRFDAFVGVAPRRYLEMFDASTRERMGHVPRKDRTGHKVPFVERTARPVFADAGLPQFRPEFREYRAKELLALDHFQRLVDESSDPSDST
jgi:deoxycytidylate deaminase